MKKAQKSSDVMLIRFLSIAFCAASATSFSILGKRGKDKISILGVLALFLLVFLMDTKAMETTES